MLSFELQFRTAVCEENVALVMMKVGHNLLVMQLLHCRLLTVTPLECELYLGLVEAVVKASGLSVLGASRDLGLSSREWGLSSEDLTAQSESKSTTPLNPKLLTLQTFEQVPRQPCALNSITREPFEPYTPEGKSP